MRKTKDGYQVGFNTQPPEGGWYIGGVSDGCGLCFNTQPPEGGWIRHY